jgi:DNA helicase-2/ATP-dependent DNA helicase PcrA
LTGLNEKQKEAVEATEGAVLVLAGAGSGKTRVLTERVANLVTNKGVAPWNILANTFTNKAAQEMRDRIEAAADVFINDMWIGTFHSMCVRMLRRYADHIGYSRNFLIYDTDDTVRVIKKILEEYGLKDDKAYAERAVKNLISKYKNDSTTLDFEAYVEERNPFISEFAGKIFERYKETLKRQDAMDFDDLLLNALLLLETDGGAREYYQHKFRYILVDEYQDTNMVQYKLVKILAEEYGNLFVVGDDDQSIYAFRGANIRNILEFEKDFPGAKVIRLEQNYRSDKKILDVANCIIKNNDGRKGKTLWSAIETGEKPVVYSAASEFEEAEKIAREVQAMVAKGEANYSDIAVLYRIHTLSRVLEEKLRIYAIPYRIYGGVSFYDRKEIKDMVAYLTIVANPAADLPLTRIINTPKRAIGNSKVAALITLADLNGLSLIDTMKQIHQLTSDKALQKKCDEFMDLYLRISEDYEELSVHEVLERIYEQTGYKKMLMEENTIEAEGRMENIEELINSAYNHDNEEGATLHTFLESIALITDLDTMDDTGGVTLMTMHAAKGLEFDTVFIAGMDENIFPSRRSVDEDNVEEERRLCYVAVTRAKKHLYILNSQMRMLYGRTQPSVRSRFIDEIDENLVVLEGKAARPAIRKKTEEQKPLFTGSVSIPKAKPQKIVDDYSVGMHVLHKSFGTGEIKEIMGKGDSRVALVDFDNAGEKKMFLAFAALEVVS